MTTGQGTASCSLVTIQLEALIQAQRHVKLVTHSMLTGITLSYAQLTSCYIHTIVWGYNRCEGASYLASVLDFKEGELSSLGKG